MIYPKLRGYVRICLTDSSKSSEHNWDDACHGQVLASLRLSQSRKVDAIHCLHKVVLLVREAPLECRPSIDFRCIPRLYAPRDV